MSKRSAQDPNERSPEKRRRTDTNVDETPPQESTPTLPNDIIAVIRDMACRVQTTGPKSLDFLITVETSTSVTDDVRTSLVRKWFLPCLEKTTGSGGESLLCHWRVISTTWNQDDADEDAPVHKLRNTVLIAVHLDLKPDVFACSSMSIPTLVFDAEDSSHFMMEPECIERSVLASRIPDNVRGVGISGVHERTMVAWWDEMTAETPNMMSVPGRGYMVHSMWEHFEDCGWNDIRETSFRFGWNK